MESHPMNQQAQIHSQIVQDRKRKRKREPEAYELVEAEKDLPSSSADFRLLTHISEERKEREAAQEQELLKPCRKKRLIKNTAVLPELCPCPATFFTDTDSGTSTTNERLMEQPLMIHGLSIPDYQHVYHSVVDQMLVMSTGEPRPYTLQLGRMIKKCLWQKLNCPLLEKQNDLHNDAETYYTESFDSMRRFVPQFSVDASLEPEPSHPEQEGGVNIGGSETNKPSPKSIKKFIILLRNYSNGRKRIIFN